MFCIRLGAERPSVLSRNLSLKISAKTKLQGAAALVKAAEPPFETEPINFVFASAGGAQRSACLLPLLPNVCLVVAVSSVAVAARALGVPAIQNRAQHARSIFGKA
jgi:hypothetical protein